MSAAEWPNRAIPIGAELAEYYWAEARQRSQSAAKKQDLSALDIYFHQVEARHPEPDVVQRCHPNAMRGLAVGRVLLGAHATEHRVARRHPSTVISSSVSASLKA